MNILIPMAGLASRFVNEGFKLPKPLIKVNGLTLIVCLSAMLIPSYVISKISPAKSIKFN